jgi:hypothetical protein
MENLKCNGACHDCGDCVGEVKRVEVLDGSGDKSWGEFNYCEKAIEIDTKNGFRVVILDEQ